MSLHEASHGLPSHGFAAAARGGSQAATKQPPSKRWGGKLPVGKLALRSPAFSFSAASERRDKPGGSPRRATCRGAWRGTSRTTPSPACGSSTLRVLVREFPDSPSTAAALRSAGRDAGAQVRLQAALELGPEGHGILLELAEKLEDDAVSAQAVTALGSTLPLERLQSVLSGARATAPDRDRPRLPRSARRPRRRPSRRWRR